MNSEFSVLHIVHNIYFITFVYCNVLKGMFKKHKYLPLNLIRENIKIFISILKKLFNLQMSLFVSVLLLFKQHKIAKKPLLISRLRYFSIIMLDILSKNSLFIVILLTLQQIAPSIRQQLTLINQSNELKISSFFYRLKKFDKSKS